MNTVSALFEEFIRAFNALDIERFAKCLSPDISIYPPSTQDAQIVEGLAAVVEHFKRVFEDAGSAGPNIRPTAVRIRQLGGEAGLVTFEFPREGGSNGKRSMVFRLEESGWRIVHIHASNSLAHERSA